MIQQHLANERTFLAWIRTVVSILGVGFVTATLHFELGGGVRPTADGVIKGIGFITLFLAFVSAAFSAASYLDKRHGINTASFRSTGSFVVFVSVILVLVMIAMIFYMALAY